MNYFYRKDKKRFKVLVKKNGIGVNLFGHVFIIKFNKRIKL